MNGKLIGGILLVVGTSIGGGMLALPVATAQAGFFGALILLFVAWCVMTIGAFLILEVNLWFPQNSNIISMAKNTLGAGGQIVAWVTYLLLLYCLLSAYISGGSDIFRFLLTYLHIHLPHWVNSLIFVIFWGSIVYLGIESTDIVNRGLMIVKLASLFLLLIFLVAHVHITRLATLHSMYMIPAITVVVTSFGFATIVPSLRSYFEGDVAKLRYVILIGSIIPLICYIAWVGAVLGEIPLTGPEGLIAILHSGHATAALTQALILFLNNPWITTVVNIFTSICMITAFLAVSLGLSDFLADGFNKPKGGINNILIYGATFVPPYIIVLIYPHAFIVGLSYGGIFCAILLILLPALMAWRGRYNLQLSANYQVWGGKILLSIAIIASLIIIFHDLLTDLKLV